MFEKKVLRLHNATGQIRYCLENCRVYGEEAFLLLLCEPHPFQYEIKNCFIEDYQDLYYEKELLACYCLWDFQRGNDYSDYKTSFSLLWEEN